ncbi:MAG: hypothetical protein LRY73_00870 [Bacillus sp. (in: Bacteria)]|nr:hypothetical protein [Bacillus sp. (in: firmicutes)]
MGLLFRRRSDEKSPKAVNFLRLVLAISITILFVLAIIDWFNIIYLAIIFILAGIGELVDGIEGYIRKENNYYLLNFTFAILLFALSIMYLT